jgi:hypothetical protein
MLYLRVTCYNFTKELEEDCSYIEFSSTGVLTEIERNSQYYNDLTPLNIEY